MATPLTDPYYTQAHEVFRRATNQTQLMLERMVDRLWDRSGLSICSVGSGAGLFELPMLAKLGEVGITVDRFVGVDVSEHACEVLEARLMSSDPGFDYELVVTPFESLETDDRYDIVLFNHVVEYLGADATSWIEKAAGLVVKDGRVMIFSPTRGGINQPYEEVFVELHGAPPIFAGDITTMLDDAGLGFAKEAIIASCDISALDRAGWNSEKLMLLSFLTQRDCRDASDLVRQRYVDYYRSLRPPGDRGIAHPTTLIVV